MRATLSDALHDERHHRCECRSTLSTALAEHWIAIEGCAYAVKYGALAPQGGRVRIQWSVQPDQTSGKLLLHGKETCLARIAEPTRTGLGSKLLFASARHGLGGDVLLDFQRDGLPATLAAPAARLVTATQATPP